MSFQITEAFVKQYSAQVSLLLQQQVSVLEPAVSYERVRGEEAFFDQIGAISAQKVTSRHADTVYTSTPHARRRVAPTKYVVADLIDDYDKVRTLIDPTSSYVQNMVMAMNRSKDTAILEAMGGTAYTGHDGTTAVTFPSGQVVPTSVGGSNTNMNLAKLIEAARLLDVSNAESGAGMRYIVMHSNQKHSLMNTTEIKSIEYNAVKALVSGTITEFMGFTFLFTNLIEKTSATVRPAYAFSKLGMLLAVWEDIESSIDRIPTKNNSVQVLTAMTIGATRMDENRVVKIECYET